MSLHSWAQSINTPVSLISELKTLESRFGITFSYLDENVKGIEVSPLPEGLNLSQSIQRLEDQTHLSFSKINERFYAISKRQISNYDYCAYLKDSETGEPVSQAIVMLDTTSVVSDDQGYIQFQSSAEDTRVLISHIGFTTLDKSLKSSSDCETILLTPKIATLEEVTVVNFIAKGIDKKVNGEYTVHTPQLQVLPGLIDADAFQSLQFLPGIFSAAESVSDINIRGGTNDQNLIQWDGIRMYQTGHFFGLISIFNPYFTNQVALTKNGTTARNGEAVSGTIAIETDDQIPAKPTVSGGFNLLNADLVANLPLSERTFVSLSARRSIANLLQTPTYDKYFDRAFGAIESSIQSQTDTLAGEVQDFGYYDLGLKIKSEISEKEEVSLSLLHAADDLNYEEKGIASNVLTKSSTIDQFSSAGGFSYLRSWSEKLNTKLSAYVSQYQLEAENVDQVNSQNLYQKNTVLDWGLKIEGEAKLNENLGLNAGYHFDELGATNEDEIDNPDFSRKEKAVLHSHVIYAESSYWSDAKNTNLRLGIRSNYYAELDRIYFEPRMTVNHKLTDRWSVDLAGEYKSQTVTQIIDLQNDFLGVEKRRWVLANKEDIPIIRSKQASVGLQYSSDGLLMSVEGYQKYVDGIVTSSQSFQNQFELIRSEGQYQVTGLDALFNYSFQNYSTWLSYTISRNYNEFKELIDEKFPSNIDIRHFVTSGINYSNAKFECSLGFNWHTGNPYTAPDENEPVINGVINYQFPNSSNLGDYFRADLSVKYKFRIGEKLNAQIGGSIWNVTNHKNEVNAYYLLDTNDDPIQIVQSGLGFTPNLSARVVF